MSCTLSIIGKNFDVDLFLKKTKLRPHHVFLKGEPIFKTQPKSKRRQYSGITILTSTRNFKNLKAQINATIRYLNRNKVKLRFISRTKEVQYAILDFGIDSDMLSKKFSHSEIFPNKLLRLAAELGLDIEVSIYHTASKWKTAANIRFGTMADEEKMPFVPFVAKLWS